MFLKEEYREWFRSSITQSVLKECKEMRKATLEEIVYASKETCSDVAFSIQGMDLIIDKLMSKGV